MKGETVFFPKGSIIYEDGAFEMFLYDLLSGRVGIFLNYGTPAQTMFAEVKSGRCFGEMGLLEAAPRTGTAVALDDTAVLRIDSENLSLYIKEEPEKMIGILETMTTKLRKLSWDYLELRKKAAEYLGEEPKENLLDLIRSRFSPEKFQKGGFSEGQARKNTIIFREGAVENWMYYIRCGTVGIYYAYGTKEQKLLSKLRSENYFGEVGLLEHTPRTLTAIALEDSVLDRIDEEHFTEYLKKNPAKIYSILQSVSYRLRNFSRDFGNASAAVTQYIQASQDHCEISQELKEKLLKIVQKSR